MQEQINFEMEKEMEGLRRDLKINRIFSAVVCVLMLCILIGGGVLWSRFENYTKVATPLMEQIARQLEAVDVEALNKAIEGLDTKALNEALENLNEAVSGFKNFTGKLFGK